MGLFKDQGVVYKPVEEVDLGPKSDHVYLRANVKGSILGPNSCFTFFFILSMHVSSPVKELLPLVGILYIGVIGLVLSFICFSILIHQKSILWIRIIHHVDASWKIELFLGLHIWIKFQIFFFLICGRTFGPEFHGTLKLKFGTDCTEHILTFKPIHMIDWY